MRESIRALIQNPLLFSAVYFSVSAAYLLVLAQSRYVCGMMQLPMCAVGIICAGLALIAILQCRKPFAPLPQSVFNSKQRQTIRTVGLSLPAILAIFTLLPLDCSSLSKPGPSILSRAIVPALRVDADLRDRILRHAETVTAHLLVFPSSPDYEQYMTALLANDEVTVPVRRKLQDDEGFPKTAEEIKQIKESPFDRLADLEILSSRIDGITDVGLARVTVHFHVLEKPDHEPIRLSVHYKIGLWAITKEPVVVQIEQPVPLLRY